MIRKLLTGTLAIAAIGGVLFGRDAVSYLKTGFSGVQDRVRREVPVEFEIERARHAVAELLPEIRKSMLVIAQEQVALDRLEESVAVRAEKLAEQEEAILALSEDLKSDDKHFVYAGRRYNEREVEKDLAERFNRFKIAEETLAREQQVLRAKKDALASHREALNTMLSQRKDLELELERLDARVRMVQSRKQISTLEIDESPLKRVQALVQEIDERLDVEDALLNAEGDFSGLIPVEEQVEEQTEDVVDAVDEYFSRRSNAESREVVSHN